MATHPNLTAWQKAARSRLRELGRTNHEVTVHEPFERNGDYLSVDITLDLTTVTRAPHGLPIGDHERFSLHIPTDQFTAPSVTVDHIRFLGYPHVLAGQHLCLYLDPSREWDPVQGMTGHMNQLWRWLDDAANDRFDANTALYHAVGGYTHRDRDTPVIVVRHGLTQRAAQSGHLAVRTEQRSDHQPGPSDADEPSAPVFLLPSDLPFGAGKERLTDLLARIDHSDIQQVPVALARKPEKRIGHFRFTTMAACAIALHSTCDQLPRTMGTWDPPLPATPVPPSTASALLTLLAASAIRQPDDTPQHVLLGVPHPAGGPHHLLGLRLPPTVANALRRATRNRRSIIFNLTSTDVSDNIDMEWCYVSDERPDVTTRRDHSRPVQALAGKNIHVWGCGGLGSWIAEYVVRAGAATVTISDPRMVTGGLLVRQNFQEQNVGERKADALARRLQAISDTTTIHHSGGGAVPTGLERAPFEADLIIDATVSHTIGLVIDQLAAMPGRTATIAKVATDVRTGTLGLAVISTPASPATLSELDNAAGKTVASMPELEDYRVFWDEPAPEDELTPTRGCSAPTFHGSAADMAAIAGTLLTLVAKSHAAQATGTYLTALPHSGVAPAAHFIPVT